LGTDPTIFQYDERIETYLRATGRNSIADLANEHNEPLTYDPEIEKGPTKYFDQLIEVNLSELEPHIVGPHTPDLARSISQMAEDVKKNDYIDKISVALIGSCTNPPTKICHVQQASPNKLNQKE
jgi:aconitate hydratase A / 2-methylisocitrate dehydratase